jgi:hypothetical protein
MDSYADLLNLNFMYSLRTGNLLTDMMIAALLPLVSGAVAYITRTWWPQLLNRLLARLSNVDKTSATFRTATESSSIYYGFTLRVALSAYVTKVLQPRFDVAELKYLAIPGKKIHEAASYTEALRDYCFVDAGPAKEVPMVLTRDLELQRSVEGGGNDGDSKEESKEENSKNGKASRDTLFTLVQYRHSFPMLQRLLQGADDSSHGGGDADKGESRRKMVPAVAELEEKMRANGDAIQFVLDRAMEHYRAEYKQAGVSTDRYLYQPLLARHALGFGASEPNKPDEGTMNCNRYLLPSEKTFSSLFFPDKPRLLQLIDNFEHKTGKYAIPGYPQKLVLLLYGPPGTGKTSLAKAVAAYTQRDLFAISLSRICSNEELLKCMFSGHVKVMNEKKDDDNNWHRGEKCVSPTELDPAKLVYILEDVDATNAIVLKDEEAAEEHESSAEDSSENSEKPTRKKKVAGSTEPPSEGAEEAGEDGNDSNDSNDSNSDKADKTSNTSSYTDATAAANADAESNSTEREVVVKGEHAKQAHKLTIEGLIKALNGVLDFPQRIVIMTTNHIEKLHPSLLRPGVVTMKLHMHNFDADCAVAMVTHYFSHTTILPEQLEELRALVGTAFAKASKADTAATPRTADGSATERTGLSPAELEQRCAECETVDELLVALRQGSHVNVF